ncbi:hypothetical protein CVT24_011121 [Panaeolus cyanescens]|uniref:F-box domain-containing protein n=1 Tax=Panaeolus cyanescens TaxID=181874 RepID=A0A409YG81_9AGAR|nr:hypothetical protein CVT24_011121 [Panaeolus cyanescens]
MAYSLTMGRTLQALPVELICHILHNLDMADLLACTMVCKCVRRVILESSRLQYTIELEKHRVVSLLPVTDPLPFATRLKILRERERAWKFIDWKKKHCLELPATGSVYEFVGGLYGNGREDETGVTTSISFLELPSVDPITRNIANSELKTWTHAMGDVTIIDFTMDPSQDLLVLVALTQPDSKYVYELHLRSIKTNQPHPKASLAVLPCLPRPSSHLHTSEVIAAVRVQVSGDLVALLIKEVLDSAGAHLELWNWEQNSQNSCSMNRNNGIDDFTFLTDESFLLVRPAGRFEVYTFKDPRHGSNPPTLRATYAFPQLSDGYMYWYISMSSNPAPGYVPYGPSTREDGSGHDQIYYPRPDERVHACCLYIFNPSGEENPHVHSFVFFLNIQTLLNPPAEWLPGHASPSRHASRSPLVSGNAQPSLLHTGFSKTSSDGNTASSTSSSPSLSQCQIPPSMPQYPLFPTFDSQAAHPPPSHITLPQSSSSHSTSSRQMTNSPPTSPSPFRPRIITSQPTVASLSPNVVIPWDVWGPQSTRWFEECLSTDWQHAIYGLRTVESVNIPRPIKKARRHVPSPSASNQPPLPDISSAPTASSSTSLLSGQGTLHNVPISHPPLNSTSALPSASEEGESSTPSESDTADDDHIDEDATDANPHVKGIPTQRRYLRVRDFNPYSFASAREQGSDDAMTTRSGTCVGKGKGKHKAGRSGWRLPRLVTEPSTTPVKGVFTHDIVSSLPYVEVVSEDTFEMTDVMMDDCRLLLLKRGPAGKLKGVDVLMM